MTMRLTWSPMTPLEQELSATGFSSIEFDVGKEQLLNLNFRNGVYALKTKVFRPRHKKRTT